MNYLDTILELLIARKAKHLYGTYMSEIERKGKLIPGENDDNGVFVVLHGRRFFYHF